MINRKIRNRLIIPFSIIAALLLGFTLLVRTSEIDPPEITDLSAYRLLDSVKTEGNYTRIGNSWITQADTGFWVMYVEGSPFEMGVINGILTARQVRAQEDYFVRQLDYFVPNKNYQKGLFYLLKIANRNLDTYIPLEYQQEIFGVSQSASTMFNQYGTPYQRLLNYHAAHDIGHALQAYNLVACTALATWSQSTSDSNLLLARNFDFYINDDFAREKILAFFKPDNGYAFASVTWGGFIGAVSGMNEKGVAVIINAAQAAFPRKVATPISILVRDILQHASNIDEAIAIANKHETFVAEQIFVASKADNKALIIEKTPTELKVFENGQTILPLTNHFRAIDTTLPLMGHEGYNDSYYRMERLQELISRHEIFDVNVLIEILRNQKGIGEESLGMGNPMAINQLICHHSIVFDATNKNLWLSAYPFNINQYLAYSLDSVFSSSNRGVPQQQNTCNQAPIAADSFYFSDEFQHFKTFRSLKLKIDEFIHLDSPEKIKDVESITEFNPDYYHSYELLGNYFTLHQQTDQAIEQYEKALRLPMPDQHTREAILEKVANLKSTKDDSGN